MHPLGQVKFKKRHIQGRGRSAHIPRHGLATCLIGRCNRHKQYAVMRQRQATTNKVIPMPRTVHCQALKTQFVRYIWGNDTMGINVIKYIYSGVTNKPKKHPAKK
jgi:hypothetical protein